MVQHGSLDLIFKSLSDPTRRDILSRVLDEEQTISELARNYDMSFAATAKHVRVLEAAQLVTKAKRGKEQYVKINGTSFAQANTYLQGYAVLWNDRFERMEQTIKETKK